MHGLRYCWITLILCTLLSSCMVGPNYHRPDFCNRCGYIPPPLLTKTAKTPRLKNSGKTQYFHYCEEAPKFWWNLFHSEPLNCLINKGIANSPNLASAYATLRQAQEALNAQIGASFYPQVTGQLSGQRQKFSGATFGETQASAIFNLYNASVAVSYTLDIFGGLRRQVEGLQAQVDYNCFLAQAAYLTLTSNIVTTAFNIASLRKQIEVTREMIRDQTEQLNIVRSQFRLGGSSGVDVAFQATQLEQTKATLPVLQQNLAQANHALSVLIGEFPCQNCLPLFDLDGFHLPQNLPLSIPSLLVQNRPDVRASEALLHAASAQIGVATANLFPQFTLTSNYGWTASIPSQLFSPQTNVWSFTGNLLQPIFNGGALLAQRRGAIAAYEAALEQYRQVVLQAFQNVADSLRALEHDALVLNSQAQAESAAKQAYIITKKQFLLGGTSFINLIIAQRQYQVATLNRVRAEGIRYTDTAALFQALGGGWQ